MGHLEVVPAAVAAQRIAAKGTLFDRPVGERE
jgi:hypothetical protein